MTSESKQFQTWWNRMELEGKLGDISGNTGLSRLRLAKEAWNTALDHALLSSAMNKDNTEGMVEDIGNAFNIL